ncbi:MAG: OmpH family outer membrane protein [Prevotellaceae bacterium]|jgi:outer membrane protein|nr:OmpH family outer membrane protein [Prevotellaceae bacterium]
MNQKTTLVFNVILAVAVIVLFILFFTQKNVSKSTVTNNVVNKGDSTASDVLPVAYINVDSLLLNYTFAKNANEELMKEQENSRATINARMRQLQGEVTEFQRKLENNAFLSRQRAEEEQARLAKKDQDLQELNAQLTDKLLQKQQKLNEALRDTINSFLTQYNETKKFQLILSNTMNDNILYAEKTYDITAEVIAELNKRMKK